MKILVYPFLPLTEQPSANISIYIYQDMIISSAKKRRPDKLVLDTEVNEDTATGHKTRWNNNDDDNDDAYLWYPNSAPYEFFRGRAWVCGQASDPQSGLKEIFQRRPYLPLSKNRHILLPGSEWDGQQSAIHRGPHSTCRWWWFLIVTKVMTMRGIQFISSSAAFCDLWAGTSFLPAWRTVLWCNWLLWWVQKEVRARNRNRS